MTMTSDERREQSRLVKSETLDLASRDGRVVSERDGDKKGARSASKKGKSLGPV